ncbi:MAG: hypothetical protein ABIO55_01700 [Ginsengibacter sp.]
MIKKVFRVLLLILLFLPLLAAAHFIAFPQETRCILIEFSDFKNKQNVYFGREVSPDIVQQLIKLRFSAEKNVSAFWKNADHIDYKLIYCEKQSDYENYGSAGAPAVAYMKMGGYVVIPKNMFDVNILSHEISHTVLYRKIGWYKLHFKIPTWFDEGLAMQVDNRDYYSIDTLLNKKSAGIILPDVMQMDTPEKFHSGSNDQVMLNYSTAKYVVHEWLKKNSLNAFIDSINKGYSFEKSYSGAGNERKLIE